MKTFTVTKTKHKAAKFRSVIEEEENVSDIKLYGNDIQLLFPDGSETNIKLRDDEQLTVIPEE